MTAGHRGLEQSVMNRLATRARDRGIDANVLLTRFVTERLLYRLSISSHANQFVLKGAMLMPVWLGDDARPTRDADLAGFGDVSDATLRSVFESVCRIATDPDGVIFKPETVRVTAIRQADEYGGRRVNLRAVIGRSRISVQIDIGIGDALSPPPVEVQLTSLLDFPAPRMRAYRPETSIAEKFHAIVVLGMANTRMKDFYDIDLLAANLSFDRATLRTAIEQTFLRRATPLPVDVPDGLSAEFASDPRRQLQWESFVARIPGRHPGGFEDVVQRVRGFLLPLL